MEKFNVIAKDNKKIDEYIEKIKQINKNFVFDQNKFDYLFVFGGDNTFLKLLKNFYNKKVNLIFINEGRVGFLSSLENLSNQFRDEDFKNFNYIEINESIQIFNEIFIHSNKLMNVDFFVNNNKFKKIQCSKILLINNLGTTGIARSYRYPIILRNNNQYIIDFLEEPMYHYYKALNQPLIISKNDNVKIAFDKSISLNIKVDGNEQKVDWNFLEINLKQSKAKLLNVNNEKLFIEKINKNF